MKARVPRFENRNVGLSARDGLALVWRTVLLFLGLVSVRGLLSLRRLFAFGLCALLRRRFAFGLCALLRRRFAPLFYSLLLLLLFVSLLYSLVLLLLLTLFGLLPSGVIGSLLLHPLILPLLILLDSLPFLLLPLIYPLLFALVLLLPPGIARVRRR